eukprot:TRINITY_DN3502_c0_g1_i2.p1 TRINITY_DN3502_c0_g1~~TRINITY_DN3502_c0_g1_i2.p1  ORF type:complete len:456 (-),score=53.94 TRINITY_DN3502_c0_g1_i2:410-1777(-)
MASLHREPSLPRSNDDESDRNSTSKPVPHYALPNIAAVLPDYTNSEADMIRQAFQTGNFRHLNTIPTEIKPNNILEARVEMMQSNRNFSLSGQYKKALNKNGLFHEFEYVESPIDRTSQIKNAERKAHKERILDISKKDFVCSSTPARLKYESAFDFDVERKHQPSFTYSIDPYESAEDEALRSKWMEKSKILHGPFIPTGSQKILGNHHHSSLPDIVSTLSRILSQDWPELNPRVYSDPNDLLICEFLDTRGSSPPSPTSASPATEEGSYLDNLSVTSEYGLVAYMNTLTQSNDVLSKFALSRVVEVWNHRIEGKLYFTFRPPWVHVRISDTYFNLHPETRSFRSRAGSPSMSASSSVSGFNTQRSSSPPHPSSSSSSSRPGTFNPSPRHQSTVPSLPPISPTSSSQAPLNPIPTFSSSGNAGVASGSSPGSSRGAGSARREATPPRNTSAGRF